jgi:hypothetical protein
MGKCAEVDWCVLLCCCYRQLIMQYPLVAFIFKFIYSERSARQDYELLFAVKKGKKVKVNMWFAVCVPSIGRTEACDICGSMNLNNQNDYKSYLVYFLKHDRITIFKITRWSGIFKYYALIESYNASRYNFVLRTHPKDSLSTV